MGSENAISIAAAPRRSRRSLAHQLRHFGYIIREREHMPEISHKDNFQIARTQASPIFAFSVKFTPSENEQFTRNQTRLLIFIHVQDDTHLPLGLICISPVILFPSGFR